MDIEKLKTFCVVAQEGSYRKACTILNTQPPNISKQISALEAEFGVELLNRFARGVTLTDEGRQLFNSAQAILQEYAHIHTVLRTKEHPAPKGPLHILTTMGSSGFWLALQLPKFLELYPDVLVRIHATDAPIDLLASQADVAFFGPVLSHHPDLCYEVIHQFEGGVYAAQSYIDKYGMPKTVDDLDHHRIISFYHDHMAVIRGNSDVILTYGKKNFEQRTPYIIANSTKIVMSLVQQGIGIAYLPGGTDPAVLDTLIPILPEHFRDTTKAYVCYPKRRAEDPNIKAFVSFLESLRAAEKVSK